eukprot:CAMPEP_0171352758 /NCGR_PEP_ID=MMETSP0878-20121228/42461_1 /TAXON_ID=67004 /ORGANISM="Thalassiosira weissflogii, Strain CCMP1336" /LENGTH=34 /DNA_ID= /DNA_START= /DNA_END= /DNA_ORIENTATION=
MASSASELVGTSVSLFRRIHEDLPEAVAGLLQQS